MPGLGMYSHGSDGILRGREGDLSIPADLDGLVTGVFGLDQRRVARRLARQPRRTARRRSGPGPDPLGPADLEQRYSFPDGDCAGQTIAIAEFGGGYFPDDVRDVLPDARSCVAADRDRVSRRHAADTPADRSPVGRTARPGARRESRGDDGRRDRGRPVCERQDLCVLRTVSIRKVGSTCSTGWSPRSPAPVGLSVSWGLAEDSPRLVAGCRSMRSTSGFERHRRAVSPSAPRPVTTGLATRCTTSARTCTSRRRARSCWRSAERCSRATTRSCGGTAPGDRSQKYPRGGSTGGGVSVKFARPEWQNVRRSLAKRRRHRREDRSGRSGAGRAARLQPRVRRSADTERRDERLGSAVGGADRPHHGRRRGPAFLAPLLYQTGATGAFAA